MAAAGTVRREPVSMHGWPDHAPQISMLLAAVNDRIGQHGQQGSSNGLNIPLCLAVYGSGSA
jgi:hypothetical protein